jgi:hypothetical protein
MKLVNVVLGSIVLLAISGKTSAVPLPPNRNELRQRILNARQAKLAEFEKKEYDFFHRNDKNRRK